MSIKLVHSSGWEKKKNDLLRDFDDLISSISSAKTKEKILWRQIYENSITDRENALNCFNDIYPTLHSDVDAHAQFGLQAVKYLERAEKSNEQLLKLATIIQKALEKEQDDDVLSADDLLNQIKENNKKN